MSLHCVEHRINSAHAQAFNVDKVASIFSIGGHWPHSSTCICECKACAKRVVLVLLMILATLLGQCLISLHSAPRHAQTLAHMHVDQLRGLMAAASAGCLSCTEKRAHIQSARGLVSAARGMTTMHVCCVPHQNICQHLRDVLTLRLSDLTAPKRTGFNVSTSKEYTAHLCFLSCYHPLCLLELLDCLLDSCCLGHG